MSDYTEFIRRAHLISQLDYLLTTGDVEYCGTAVEVRDESERELFHLVLDESTGEVQVLFLAHSQDFRLSISQLKQMLEVAESQVRLVEPP